MLWIIGLACALFLTLLGYYKWAFTYWSHRKVPCFTPSIPFGHATNPLTGQDGIGTRLKIFYNEMKTKGWKHAGLYFYSTPVYVVINPNYIKNILVKNFENFQDRGNYHDEASDPLSAHLFAVGGQKWKTLRTQIAPAFTPTITKALFNNLVNSGKKLVKNIAAECEKHSFNIAEKIKIYQYDTVAASVFDMNPLESNTSKIRKYGDKISFLTKWQIVKKHFARYFPTLARILRLRIIPEDSSEFFINSIKKLINCRPTENNNSFNNYLQFFTDQAAKKKLDLKDIIRQSFVFYAGKGYADSCSSMTLAIYELARNQDIQEKLRQEINIVLQQCDGNITYDSILKMKYMHQVVEEVLRKYPTQTLITRKCVKDYKLPEENLTIEKGTLVVVPIFGIHHDTDYYPNPEMFDPERFSDENKKKLVRYTYLPFGEGPRKCVAMQLALVVMKMAIISLISEFKFKVDKEKSCPLIIRSRSGILTPEGGVWLQAERI